jgi:hypothetical protein
MSFYPFIPVMQESKINGQPAFWSFEIKVITDLKIINENEAKR